MVKRIWAFMLAAILLLAALPVTGFAAQEKVSAERQLQIDALVASTKESYDKTLISTEMASLNGYCGKMVSHQLWHMGINMGLVSNHGNKQYDMYAKMRRTSGGKYISAYPAADYTLLDALNAISEDGTKDVYNILVGFEWTNTKAGGKYGHVCLINGILDGKVYFAESFPTRYAPEGEVNICTIEEFAALYAAWTRFEGVIYFADSYLESCKRYGTDLFVLARFEMPLRSMPSLLGKQNCKTLRTVSAGERLRVTAVLENPDGERYYQVKEKDRTGYIVAQAAVLERTNYEDITIRNLKLKKTIKEGTKEALSGAIAAENGLVGAVEVVVRDAEGAEVARKREITDCRKVILSQFSKNLGFDKLTPGKYTVTVSAETAAAYIREDMLDYSYTTILLAGETLWVGEMGEETVPVSRSNLKEEKHGWYWEDGLWHCYENGEPRTGWYTYMGVTYYLDETGTVTTGWVTIEEQKYYFSDTGAMHTGWLRTRKGLQYSGRNGIFVDGWQVIDYSKYYFRNGYVQTSGTRTEGGVKYKFQKDGKAIAIN